MALWAEASRVPHKLGQAGPDIRVLALLLQLPPLLCTAPPDCNGPDHRSDQQSCKRAFRYGTPNRQALSGRRARTW